MYCCHVMTSRRRLRCKGLLITCAVLICVGMMYLIFSPDPQEHLMFVKEEAASAESTAANRHCDDLAWGSRRLSVVVPFRDRFEELLEFIPYMHNFLCKQHIRHQFFIVNQVDEFRFNRGALLNVGFLLSENASFDYIAAHDVDLLPVNEHLSYSYPENGPYHVSSPELHPKYHYASFFGGILLMKNEDFRLIRGFSNNFWGWGREDDELYKRVKEAGLTIFKPEGITTGNATFRHIHNSVRRPRDSVRIADQKAYLRRDRVSGLDTIEYDIESVRRLRIDNVAEATVVNVRLSCDLETTPWCVTSKHLTAIVRHKRQQLSPNDFARLLRNLRRHGIDIDEESL